MTKKRTRPASGRSARAQQPRATTRRQQRRKPETVKRQAPLPPAPPSEASAAAHPDEETAPTSPGRLGRYELLFELGRGGMGAVYAGRLSGPHDFDRVVAVKRLRTTDGDDDDRAALLAEARLGALIRHPNVVQIFELAEHAGEPFVAMELIEGVSLARLLKRLRRQEKRLDADLAAWIIERAALGLSAAHKLKRADGSSYELVHRDISPDNILLSFDGRVCVSDFGIALFNGNRHTTERGMIKGKLAYMSPEQTRAERVDHRSDLFAIGAVLHEALSGERLFRAPSAAAVLHRVCELQAPDLSELYDDVSPELASLTQRCLHKQPDERPQSASQLAQQLRALRRTSGASVDDTDLAQLLDKLFPGERVALHTRLHQAAASSDETDETAVETPELHSLTVRGSVITNLPMQPRRNWLLALGALVLLGGAALWWSRATSQASSDQTAASATPSALGKPTAATTAPASTTAAPPSASSSAAPESSATSKSHNKSDARTATPGPRPTPPRVPPAASALPSATPTATPSTDHRGIPFGTL